VTSNSKRLSTQKKLTKKSDGSSDEAPDKKKLKKSKYKYSENDIFLYLKSCKYPDGMTRSQKPTFRHTSREYSLDETKAMLYRGHDENKRIVPLTKTEQIRVIQGISLNFYYHLPKQNEHFIYLGHHDENKHPKSDTVYRILKLSYYWRNMREMINEHIKRCPEKCQHSGPKLKKAAPKLRPIKPPREVWSLVGIDLQGKFPVTPRGNAYILIVKCYLSKFFLVRPIPTKEAEVVALKLYKVYCEFGFVKAYITDQGKEFYNQVILITISFFHLLQRSHPLPSAH
jgi:hypothetical protein